MKTNNTINLAAAAVVCLSGVTSAHALQTEKRDLKNNMMFDYNITPKEVVKITEMFNEGVLYGSLRSNMFAWDWKNEQAGATADNSAWGVGGSLIYSTGYLNGFGATAGMYTTHTINTDNATTSGGTTFDAGTAGKDTYSRADGSGAHIDVLALSYLEYKFAKTDIKVGRQIFESALLRSNDTKMIPNTFEGYAIESKDVPDTKLSAAYFTKQKLRDHRDFHSVIAYQGSPEYGENDDTVAHKGLTIANIEAAGAEVEPGMIVATIENKSVKGLKLNLDGMYIDEFVSSAIAEVNYKINLGESGWSLTPGARYIKQFDEGAGAIGGAALSGKAAFGGYGNANSVDGGAWMARMVLEKGAGKVMAGYSAIDNDADLIACWRGFPTGGYTRSMAQYNWEANTKSWMVKAAYDFGKAGMVDGLSGSLDYASMDYDEAKIDVGSITKTDKDIVHLDVLKTFTSIPNIELKFRAAVVTSDKNPYDAVVYQTYNEYRFEINYLF